jgi:anthranilate synthase component 1
MERLQAVTRQYLADRDTPVSAFVKLCPDQDNAFLFESGEDLSGIGRYSIVAWDPLAAVTLSRREVTVDQGALTRIRPAGEFFGVVRELMAQLTCQDLPDLPFVGACSGYIGYEAVGLIERLPAGPDHDLPVARLCFPSRFAVFDHLGRSLTLVGIAADQTEAEAKLDDIERRLNAAPAWKQRPAKVSLTPPPRDAFLEAVGRAKGHIRDGDIFQVVLSGRFSGETDLDPLSAYRWLRVKSPSPYMFYLKFPDCRLVGASPETQVRVENGRVFLRPIAGTRGRSSDPETDLALEREMCDSPKERAEHVMLVDLARNDAGRVCGYGSVRVSPYMIVERYSHVMHLVSQVSGRLAPGWDVWDVFAATFPAGTVSGAPKIRAMEIIHDLEAQARGPYAGAVGCFGPGDRMDTCIAIRMIQFTGDQWTIQSGAGIVADSVPEMEYQEIEHKAAQGIAALEAAAGGLR